MVVQQREEDRERKRSSRVKRLVDKSGIMDVLLHTPQDSTPSARQGKQSRQRSEGSRGQSAMGQSYTRSAGRQAFELPDNSIGDRLEKLKKIFETADDDGQNGLSMDEFHTAMSSTIGQRLSRRDLELLFMKVDANCDGSVDWEEFVTYILLEFQEKSLMLKMLKETPFPNERREIFSRHRDTILSVIFFSSSKAVDYASGRYVTLAKDGTVSFWSLELKLQHSYRVGQNRERMTQVWMTDMVSLPSSSMIAIASTDRDIMFFDLGAKKFFKKYLIKGLEHCVNSMDYWVDVANPRQAVLVWGDMAGNVYTVTFQNVSSGCLFGTSRTKQQLECKTVTVSELQRGLVPGVKLHRQLNVHEGWVSHVRYIPELASCISSCASEGTAMYVSDFENKKCAYFKIRKGLLCFDYCPKNNIIVTGGMDYYIRVWNPHVNSKAIFVLKAHSQPITHILVNHVRDHCISLDRSKTACIHDLADQQLLQKISGRAMNLGTVPVTAVFFNPKLQSLILATDHLAVLEKKEEEERFSDVLSHNKPVCAALFNPAFQQVVTACEGSVVSVWDINTGKKAMQFLNAHKRYHNGVELPVEITAMSFDAGGRRLITGAKNGTVKMWNYNNGCCIVDFKVPDGKEITAVFHTSHRIYVTGWNRQVGVFIESGTNNDYKAWRCVHRNDVLTMAFLSPNILATGSYDGDIVIWSRETGQLYCRLNANESHKPLTDVDLFKKESFISLESDGTASTSSSVEDNAAPTGIMGKKLLRATKKPARVKSASASRSDPSDVLRNKFSHPLLPALNVNCGRLVVTDGDESRVPLQTRKGYDNVCKYYEAAVECIIFLESRENHRHTATVVASGAEGWVRFWSTHHKGGLLGQFRASQRKGESVRALATDKDNLWLMTGDTAGYLNIWDISDFCINKDNPSHTEVSVDPSLSYIEGLTSMRWNRPPPESSLPLTTLKEPPLRISFRAHTKAIRHLECVNERDMIITSSDDCSVRLWTRCGRYVGTFGEPWSELPERVDPKSLPPKIPGELRRVASATTLKVLNGGKLPHWRYALNIIRFRGVEQIKQQFTHLTNSEEEKPELDKHETDARLGKSTILGQSYKRTTRHRMEPVLPELREVYSHVSYYVTFMYAL